jgi:hypothetical protein
MPLLTCILDAALPTAAMLAKKGVKGGRNKRFDIMI